MFLVFFREVIILIPARGRRVGASLGMPQSPYSLYKFSEQRYWHLAKLLIPVWATALSWYMSWIFANIDAPCSLDVAPRLKVDFFCLPSWIVSNVSKRGQNKINQVILLDVFVMPCATVLVLFFYEELGQLVLSGLFTNLQCTELIERF